MEEGVQEYGDRRNEEKQEATDPQTYSDVVSGRGKKKESMKATFLAKEVRKAVVAILKPLSNLLKNIRKEL